MMCEERGSKVPWRCGYSVPMIPVALLLHLLIALSYRVRLGIADRFNVRKFIHLNSYDFKVFKIKRWL